MVNTHEFHYNVPISEFFKPQESSEKFLIKGIAINATTTRNGVEYPSEELQLAAVTLCDKPLLKDHNNSVDAIVGRTTNNCFYQANKVLFEAAVMDADMQQKISDGRIKSVSIGAFVKNVERNESAGTIIAKGIEFGELSFVAVPADPNAGFTKAFYENFRIAQVKSTTVQTLILSKDKFKSSSDAKKWASDHDFKSDKVDETEDSYRLRQKDPGDFEEDSFRTIELSDGVKAVIGKLKSGEKSLVRTKEVEQCGCDCVGCEDCKGMMPAEQPKDVPDDMPEPNKHPEDNKKPKEEKKMDTSTIEKEIGSLKESIEATNKALAALMDLQKNQLRTQEAELQNKAEAEFEEKKKKDMTKGVVSSSAEQEDSSFDGMRFERVGNGFSMWADPKDLPADKFKRLVRD